MGHRTSSNALKKVASLCPPDVQAYWRTDRESFCGLGSVLLKSRFEIHCRDRCSYKCEMVLSGIV